jgi:hypothetical protein
MMGTLPVMKAAIDAIAGEWTPSIASGVQCMQYSTGEWAPSIARGVQY